MKVVLLHDEIRPDAREDELDALVQAEAIAGALRELGHTSERAAFSLDMRAVAEDLRRRKPDVVFNLAESVEGQGRLAYLPPALLDVLKLPYTGGHTEAMFITSNKVLTKRMLSAHRIATAPWLAVGPVACAPGSWSLAGASGSDQGSALPLPGRYIIKSVWEEASLGLEDDSVVDVRDAETLQNEIARRTDGLGGEAFAELFIEGREFNLSVLAGPNGPEVFPPAEIHFVDYPADRLKLVGYRAKWDSESFEFHHTPRCFDFPATDAGLLRQLCALAKNCWNLLGLRGYARVDFRVDAAGRPWVLEINSNPCLSPDAGFPAAAQRGGLSFSETVRRILADACGGSLSDVG